MIFADHPFAVLGEPEFIWGWHDQCPEHSDWNKQPINDDIWLLQGKQSNVWNKVGAKGADWSGVEKKTNYWSVVGKNDQDHHKC
jgi:hypothetical protein